MSRAVPDWAGVRPEKRRTSPNAAPHFREEHGAKSLVEDLMESENCCDGEERLKFLAYNLKSECYVQ